MLVLSRRIRQSWWHVTPAGLHPIQSSLVRCHLLVDDAGKAVIIDTGMLLFRRRLQHLLQRLGLGYRDLQAILLTHGHIDHTANTNWLRQKSNAPVYAHPAEQEHIAGTFPYRRAARVCGVLEGAARRVINYQPASIDVPLCDGDELPFWGGLRVVHLPGHTDGHCGFWSGRHRLLFAGDLVAIGFWGTILPPAIFNSAPQHLQYSVMKATALRPRLLVPNHYREFNPRWLAEQFDRFAARFAERPPAI